MYSPRVTDWVRQHEKDKIFYPRVKHPIPLSGMQEKFVLLASLGGAFAKQTNKIWIKSSLSAKIRHLVILKS